MKFILSLILILHTAPAFSAKIKDIYLGVGNLTEHVKKVQKDSSGKTNTLDFHPTAVGGIEIRLGNRISMYPEVGIMVPYSDENSKTTRMTYYSWLNFGYLINDLTFRLGVGANFTRISSEGGTESLNNGNSIDTFYLPKYSATSYNYVIVTGIQYFFHKKGSFKIDSSMYNPTEKLKRSFSYILSLNYHFGGVNLKW